MLYGLQVKGTNREYSVPAQQAYVVVRPKAGISAAQRSYDGYGE